ncbi:MAG: response regulator [Halothiobacillaceae bacterium]|nr:MAG: response regulator [Halothiobacillaceae bacterium]
MAGEQIVYIVDDDAAVRDSLSWLIRSIGLRVDTYASGQQFLNVLQPSTKGCVLLDVRMPGMSGLDLHEQLIAEKRVLPVIMITGHGDVPMAVRAVKAGAFDFIEKPFNDQVLLDRIQQALKQNREILRLEAQKTDLINRLALLTPREQEVLKLVVVGNPNKAIAAQLGISCRTVEIHRGRVMEKMEASSLPELVHQGVVIGLL